MVSRIKYFLFVACVLLVHIGTAQQQTTSVLERNFKNPPPSAHPWVFWYWMQAAVSKEGITADLEAMKQVGIAGAYLMPIKDTTSPPLFQPAVRQLSPEWWEMVRFAMQEAKRLNLQLAMHVSDGFALAGGPWITPELSMQKIVWTKTYAKAGTTQLQLAKPESIENYYKDITVVAFPTRSSNAFRPAPLVPVVTTSNGTRADFLAVENSKESFRSDTACWIQYSYSEPFTLRSVRIHVGGNNYQAQRLIVQSGNDGVNFTTIARLEPPRHGWQDTDEDVTHAIPAITSKYFRFVYDKEGSEPGAEDLDAAKWKPSFKVVGIYVSDEPVINQYESKNGSIWRISKNTTTAQVPDEDAIPLKDVIDLSSKMDANGNLQWTVPPGNWVVVRIGHTSTGHTNATGGGGKGLECDKFNPAAIRLQFDNWFALAFSKTNPALAKEVLKIFHVDSWECGSQNWSPSFRNEFQKRRGYDPVPYLLAMTGVPIENAATSEKFLHDVRQTIAGLVNDVFYKTLSKLAHEKGCSFSAESVAPTMVSDGMLHYKTVDMPMGEFWLNSPTHDKPNDMMDAISGAHIYGKNIVQAEAFTTLRMNWAEHPGMLKTLGDRNFALGINRFVLHVFTHNPWLNRKPGMTLDGVGLYYQRNQTWFKQSKAWIDYLSRCQWMLQQGKPVVDIAVFTGEELPRRSVLPDRLVSTLPGIFGKNRIEAEKKRLTNTGQPLRTIPDGVSHSANMADPQDWIDPLNGYAYDSFNPDALSQAVVKNGRIVLPGGASYSLLVIPGKHPMNPNSGLMSMAAAKKLLKLVKDGATILLSNEYTAATGLKEKDDSVKIIMQQLFGNKYKGKVILTPFTDSSFAQLQVERDISFGKGHGLIAWNHRKSADADIYFVSNQSDSSVWVPFSVRVKGMKAEIWYPYTGEIQETSWSMQKGREDVGIYMEGNESAFIVFRKPGIPHRDVYDGRSDVGNLDISKDWYVIFDTSYGGPEKPVLFSELTSWSKHSDSAIRYYSGTATYRKTFEWQKNDLGKDVTLKIDSVCNIATVRLNGKVVSTLWSPPYLADITKFLKAGANVLEIEVSNTWANRLIHDHSLTAADRITWTTAPFRLGGKKLLPAGLVGSASIVFINKYAPHRKHE
jgi:hypothetical protein